MPRSLPDVIASLARFHHAYAGAVAREARALPGSSNIRQLLLTFHLIHDTSL